MHIMVLGLRGFPGIQGGVETHAEHLYPKLRDLGCNIEVTVRSPYWNEDTNGGVQGIRFSRLWCPARSGAEAFVHSFLGVLYAGLKRPDVLHIHAIGPSLFAPLAKLLGLRVVVTHHGPDYDREKWGPLAKRILRLGERMGVQYSNERIVISQVIRDIVCEKYRRSAFCIPNGVAIPNPIADSETLGRFGLEPGRYLLTVSRMVPEKRHLDLIEAFDRAQLNGWKLALVGGLTPETDYSKRVIAAATKSDNVVLTDFQSGRALHELYAHAGLFVLPSTHEGLPIALLEALSYGLPCIASDIPANLEVGLTQDQYFHARDTDDLARCLMRATAEERPADYRMRLQQWVRSKYDWQSIARSTLGVYKRVSQDGWGQRIRMTWMPE